MGFISTLTIQLGTLSTLLKSQGWAVKSHYLNLHFAHQLGVPIYNQLCEKRFLVGEWLFSHLLFGENPKNLAYVSHFESHIDVVEKMASRFHHLANLVP